MAEDDPPTPVPSAPPETQTLTPSPPDPGQGAAPPTAKDRFEWEDGPALGALVALLVAAELPWWSGQDFLPLAMAKLGYASLSVELHRIGVAGLAILGLIVVAALLAGRRSAMPRRLTSVVLGLAAIAIAGYTGYGYFRFHNDLDPGAGIAGHLTFIGPGLYLALLAGLVLAWSGIRTDRAGREAPTTTRVDSRLRVSARTLLPLVLFLATFAWYQTDLGNPAAIDFDESHYVHVALNLTDGQLINPDWNDKECPHDCRPFNFEHPPIGKYFISAGYALYGQPHDELGWNDYHELCKEAKPECAPDARSWRLGSAFAGSLGVLGIYWLGLRLFGTVSAGLLAAGFLLTDNLYYLHSRIAMLDIFPIAFALLAAGVSLGPKRWHPWAGSVLFGLAVASKLSALFLVPPFFLLVFLTSKQTNRWMRLRDALIRALILPAFVYVLAYLPYWIVWGGHGITEAVRSFLFVHGEAFKWLYRAKLDKPHPHFSEPWTWIPMRRPVFYYLHYEGTKVAHIYAVGNAFVWWAGSVAMVYTWILSPTRFLSFHPRLGLRAFWEWIGRPFAMTRANATLLASLFFACAYGPYFAVHRGQFNFYFLQAAPFFSLLLAGYLAPSWDAGGGRRLLTIVALVAAACVFAFFHPVSAGTHLTEQDFQYIMRRIPGMTQ